MFESEREIESEKWSECSRPKLRGEMRFKTREDKSKRDAREKREAYARTSNVYILMIRANDESRGIDGVGDRILHDNPTHIPRC